MSSLVQRRVWPQGGRVGKAPSGGRILRRGWVVKESFEDLVRLIGYVRRHQKLHSIDSGQGFGAELAWQKRDDALGFEHVPGKRRFKPRPRTAEDADPHKLRCRPGFEGRRSGLEPRSTARASRRVWPAPSEAARTLISHGHSSQYSEERFSRQPVRTS